MTSNQVDVAFDCPIPIPDQSNIETEYSDDFTRNKIAPIVAGSYAKTNEEILGCLNNHFDGPVIYKTYTVPCPGINDTCFGYIAIAEEEKMIFLAFRGSSITQYLLENVQFITFTKVPYPPGGKILDYWSDAFFTIWNSGLSNDLASLLPQYQSQDFKLWITGHSLGGVLAALSAQYVINNQIYPQNLVKFISFGEPRIGDEVFAQIFDNVVPYKYRVINRHDPIPHQPYRLPGQTGNDSFWHHHYEVWYPQDMCLNANFTICSRAEDPNCSNSAGANVDPTIKDHAYYFGVSITTWYQDGCNISDTCHGKARIKKRIPQNDSPYPI
uniref:Fungal lipase-like domain-containing protein n=1 Tax=Acrobeloides nanus TaxID=290746 RepID=A0A914C0N9_9BILA